MFIVIMVVGADSEQSKGGSGCSSTLVSKAPSLYGGHTDGNSGT